MGKEKSIEEMVLEMLESQQFVNWYEGKFQDYVEGEEDCDKRDQILVDLKRYLR